MNKNKKLRGLTCLTYFIFISCSQSKELDFTIINKSKESVSYIGIRQCEDGMKEKGGVRNISPGETKKLTVEKGCINQKVFLYFLDNSVLKKISECNYKSDDKYMIVINNSNSVICN